MWGGPDRVRATTRLVIYTLVGSFFMLVGGDRHRRAGLQPARHPAHVRAQLAARPAALAHHADLGVPGLRRGLPGQDAARPLPRLAARRLQGDADPRRGRVLGDPVQGRRLRLPAHRAAAVPLRRGALPDADAAHRAGLDPVGDVGGHDHARRAARRRLLSVAQLGFIMLGMFSLRPEGAQGALLQMVNHALVTAPLFFIVAALAARAGGSEKLRDMGGIAFRAPVLAACSSSPRSVAGDARLVELRRRVHDPAGRVQRQAADRADGLLGVVGAAVYALRAFIRSMHNRVGPPRRLRSRSRSRRSADRAAGGRDPRARVLSAVRPASAPSRRSTSTVAAGARRTLAASAPTHKVAQVP